MEEGRQREEKHNHLRLIKRRSHKLPERKQITLKTQNGMRLFQKLEGNRALLSKFGEETIFNPKFQDKLTFIQAEGGPWHFQNYVASQNLLPMYPFSAAGRCAPPK